jgi:TetR/AcrR family transcriptional repressor of bet genes
MPGERASEDVRREQILQASFEVASREGIGGLTIRAVAAEAKLSHSLVVFYFQRKERLVLELLEWLIATTAVLYVPPEVARITGALDRLHAVLQRELARLLEQRKHTRLFFEYWARGTNDDEVRARISAELERYRATFRVMMEELLAAEPAAFRGVSADAMAAVAVSWLQGCAVQGMIAPEHFDMDAYLAAVRGFTTRLAEAQP